ncbi:AraC family transcriptional activator of tynA and feaB [Kitasatospora sp. GAS204A]|uniref:helix-turn-helix domain-containing protein n=1 Tax=unclassified Kitasatospora TaxID=2633591 RepID=UPI00247470DA|nr:helix-turn-helix domain-containing protein [Kitasatospora sp. GAS204B]MDH6120128.1 AraC family transcriptional activator of tynA and feaB [Kitasatospora sp. GAS204B]
MTSTGVETDAPGGRVGGDSAAPDTAPRAFDAFRSGWETEIGDGFPLPTFSAATTRDFRVKSRATKVGDVAITDLHGDSAIRTEGPLNGVEDQVRMYVVQRGSWTLGAPLARGEQTVRAGQFLIRHIGRPLHFETVPDTTAKVLVLPAAMLTPLLGARQSVSGPADSAEVRLLVAHSNMIYETVADLGPAGVQAAHNTLIELAKSVARCRVDDAEPRLAPALAQAAKDLADSHLADPELSGTMLARELNVSVRNLQRAFAAAGESVTAYIRQRRLEEARLALTAPSGRLSVSELAAHWQFADSSHFIRAFKKHYGRTPTEYARSAVPARNRAGTGG